jgi:hypothetical protein
MMINNYIWSKAILKGHGNEVDFLGVLHKLVPHESLTLPFEPFRFGFEFEEIFVIGKRTPQLAESGSRQDCL